MSKGVLGCGLRHLARVHMQTSIGQRSFAFCGPTVWNSLWDSALTRLGWKLNYFSESDENHPVPLRRFHDSGTV